MSKSLYLDPELAVGSVPHRPERSDAVEALGELADDDVTRHQDPALLDVVAEAEHAEVGVVDQQQQVGLPVPAVVPGTSGHSRVSRTSLKSTSRVQ